MEAIVHIGHENDFKISLLPLKFILSDHMLLSAKPKEVKRNMYLL